MTRHQQVSFVTKNGHRVKVDEGIFDVLKLLANLGVETQFSCEHEIFGRAYICAEGKGIVALTRKMRKAIKQGVLTKQSQTFAELLLKNAREWEFAHFTQGGENQVFFCKKTRRQKKGKRKQAFSLEYSYSKTYGFRACMRWPYFRMSRMERLLIELLEAGF